MNLPFSTNVHRANDEVGRTPSAFWVGQVNDPLLWLFQDSGHGAFQRQIGAIVNF